MSRTTGRPARPIIGLAAPATAAGLLALLAGCAEPDPEGTGPQSAAGPDRQVYEVAAIVLEEPGTGPQLCQAVADSYPPQCSGPEVAGWDWSVVESESASGTTWGSYRLTGTWDGQRFTLAGQPEPDTGPGDPEQPDFTSPCPEPAEGWRPVDPATATQDALDAALARAAADPGYAGAWLDQSYLDGQADRERLANDPARLVLNLRFTGDLAERERAIREVWGGAVCVSGAERTEAELVDIQQRLHEDLPDLVLGSGVDTVANAVTAQVYVADPALQRDLDERYGEGAVILDGWLHPVG